MPQQAIAQGSRQALIAQRYQITHELGEGRWSKVFLAKDIKHGGKPYAVKILKPTEMEDDDNVRRFQQEVQLTQQLHHPNIVRVYSSGFTTDGLLYLVTDYLPGGDLEQYLRSYDGKPLPFLRAVNLLRFLARGLGHAHERQVLHRDVKPANILLTPSRNIKIADFGIGRSLRYHAGMTQEVIGTPVYMAPERFADGEIGPWSDVYSFGILSFELLTGRRPFEAEELGQIMYQHCFTEPPTILFKGGAIPCWMEDIVHKACEKEPSRRFHDANEISQTLERYFRLEREGGGALSRFFYVIRPNGKFCTMLTERGVPRKRLGGYLLVAVVVVLLLFFAVR